LGAFFHELFRAELYKRNQGRIARQVTAVAVAIVIGLGAWSFSTWSGGQAEAWINNAWMRFGIPFFVAVVGMWAAFRLVNMPSFADFLISVEAEMNKVSWPARTELFRASIVVLCVIFVLALVLFAYDLFWRELLELLRIIE
jgi:preprotein translocase subunit SecE